MTYIKLVSDVKTKNIEVHRFNDYDVKMRDWFETEGSTLV